MNAQLSFLSFPKTGKSLFLGNANNLGQAETLAQLVASRKGQHLVIASSVQDANQLMTALPFFLGKHNPLPVLLFPDRETLPYDRFSPHEDLTSERLALLNKLPQLPHAVIVVAAQTLMSRLPEQTFLLASSFMLSLGENLDMHQRRSQLEASGYRAVKQVLNHGEYAIRGSIFDVFPMGSKRPFRIDLFGDEIDSIRTFDPETQRSFENVESIHILPAHEFPLTEEACQYFITQWQLRFADKQDSPVLKAVQSGRAIGGLEYYLPLFFEKPASLFDYLHEDVTVYRLASATTTVEQYWQQILNRYKSVHIDRDYPPLLPETLFISPQILFQHCNQKTQIHFESSPFDKTGPHKINLPYQSITFKNTGYAFLKDRLTETPINHTLICAESLGRQSILEEQLRKHRLDYQSVADWEDFITKHKTASQKESRLYLTLAPLAGHFSDPTRHITLISESSLFGEKYIISRTTKRKDFDEEAQVRDLGELSPGAPVVHLEHGIGIYQGLTRIELNGQVNEFLTLSYANEDKLYVPTSDLHLLSRYSGIDKDHIHAHKLGTDKWSKAKEKAFKRLHDVAAELLALYAKRAAQRGHAFTVDEKEYQKFADEFPYTETEDQASAIAQVLRDLASPQPMDRLLCGDVGFGKTEVAMRAAFVAAQQGKQVAILGPTTLLVQQHYESFKDRFAHWPFEIESLSRFKSSKQQTEIREKVLNGQIDIIIGTHGLISEKIGFKNLGLIIIDEEHRFGVRHKEKLKKLRSNIDVLSMTATPIPRTLNMALSSLRDLSVIATAPAKRLSVQTFVREYQREIIQEAILREIYRGGQVYYLHNSVDTIYNTQEELQKLLPDVQFNVAHGQMPERQLEKVMNDFSHNRFQVLICTTIIETGIDIPNANTIIIDRADKLGLAQLHQLRGRVGRSHHQAYAYLITPPWKTLNSDAKKRLEAIQEASSLGAGFQIAQHDLEIRGAGELLGDEQSGHMQAIGYDLYVELLNRTVKAIQQGRSIDFESELKKQTLQIDLGISTFIPEEYMPDVQQRLMFYQQLAQSQTPLELTEIKMEIIDRYGKLPLEALQLFAINELRFEVIPFGIQKIDGSASRIKVTFSPTTPVEPMKIIRLIQLYPNRYKLAGQEVLLIQGAFPTPETRLSAIKELLSHF